MRQRIWKDDRRSIVVSILFMAMLLTLQPGIRVQQARASVKNGTSITLTQAGQVIDSITYHGIIVDAVYSNQSYASNDATYSCAALIKKFYSAVYGINVYNLISSSSVPLVYGNAGSFTLTAGPRKGDIVRTNYRTHWAIVKSVEGNTVTVIQQSYKSGSQAWINCTIDLTDPDFSYFTYSNRIEDDSLPVTSQTETSQTETGTSGGITSEISGTDSAVNSTASAALLQDGSYHLLPASYTTFLSDTGDVQQTIVKTEGYHSVNDQWISVIHLGDQQYACQFYSSQRFLSIDKNDLPIATNTMEQKFIFVPRGNGYYTISPAEHIDKVLLADAPDAQGNNSLRFGPYTGSANELWNINYVSANTLKLIPRVTISKKTLYQGYQDYAIKITPLVMDTTVTYTSNLPDVVSVSENGLIHPVRVGKAVVTVNIVQNDITYSYPITITVKEPYLKLSSEKKEISVGESLGFTVKAYGTDKTFRWTISDSSLAELDGLNGILIGKKSGTVTVAVTNQDGKSVSMKVKIIA